MAELEQRLSFMKMAVELAIENVRSGDGGPFGALIVKDGQLISSGTNAVAAENDPTAHAEIVAIRRACQLLETFQLTGCEVYCSCEPCPMCLGALYWARPDAVYFAGTHEDAASAGFDDGYIYREFELAPEERKLKVIRIPTETSAEPFDLWLARADRVEY